MNRLFRRIMGVVVLSLVLIVCIQLRIQAPSERTAIERVPLTVQQTVGLAFCTGAPPCVKRRANPDAKEVFFKILHNPKLREFHPNAASNLGLICDVHDLDRIESEIARIASSPVAVGVNTSRDKLVVRSLCFALARMGLRDIEPARTRLEMMTSDGYWTSINATYFSPGTSPIVTDADFFRALAFEAYFILESDNPRELISKAISDLDGYRRGSLDISLRAAFRSSRNTRSSFFRECDDQTHADWIAKLPKYWNGDLDNPQPTTISNGLKHES
ncbi:MAG: hypothetical protein KDA47_13895 [Planctomycetales bacterium]|nr:hypothetical protein [Planctomycetales bacterium]